MIPSSRRLLRTALPLVALALLAAYSYARMHNSGQAVISALEDDAACRKLSGEILELRKLPQFAVLESGELEPVTERIETAASASQLPTATILRIQPQPPTRIGDSSYRVRTTRVELRDVTLAQVVRFARELADESRGLTVRDLRLWNPQGASRALTNPEIWSAEITLTQLTFAPPAR